MNEKILYVTDLDGTLLTNDKRITPFSRATLDSLIEAGALITYATARSYVSARQIIGDFEPKIPVIIYNGTFILDLKTNEKLLIDSFSCEDVCEIKALLEQNDIYPFVYATVDGEERFSYVKERANEGQEHFLSEHKGDKRENPVEYGRLYCGEVFHFTIMGDELVLKELCSELEAKYECVCYKEQYSGDWWLEIHPKGASKANAIATLKRVLDAHRVVCFGDGKNDISMFEACDESYAVANADESLKKIATGIIGSNEDDGVARWLLEHIKL